MRMGSIVAVVLGAASLLVAGAASAQSGASATGELGGVAIHVGASGMVATTPSRIASSRREMNRAVYNASDNPDFPTDPLVIRRQAQAALDRASERCQVTEASIVGASADNTPVFETICSAGIGFIVTGQTRSMAIECAALSAATAERRARRDMEVVSECQMPGNQMTLGRISAYAREAGVACDIRDGGQIGRTGDGAVFEVGCGDGAGYWVRRSNNGWGREDCLKVTALNDTCRFSTPVGRIAQLNTRLGSTSAAGCGIAAVGYVGQAGADEYYEVRCQSGAGYVLQVGSDDAVRAALTCAEAQASLGAACRLTGA